MEESLAGGKAELWRGRIEEQRVSGRSVREWCRAGGVAEHSFYWWRHRLGLGLGGRRGRRGAAAAAAAAPAFARVELIGSAAVEPVRLVLRDGRELILPASMPMESMVRLIGAIEREGKPCGAGGAA